jgi:hypothetical protein
LRDVTAVFKGTERLDLLSRDRKEGDRTSGTERHGSGSHNLGNDIKNVENGELQELLLVDESDFFN